MSFKHVAIIAVIATATVAAVTALAANPTAAPAPAASQVDASACPQAPWPFGCQWRVPTRRVVARYSRDF